jgi:hypothetical protein
MKRILAIVLSTSAVLAAGCGYRSYEMRLEATEARIRDEMKLDAELSPPIGGDFQKLNVHFRPPKGWVGSPDFAPELRQNGVNSFDDQMAPVFDLKASYSAPAAKADTTKKDEGPPPPSPMLRFLARRKHEQTDTEKGEAPPPVERGDFQSDLRQWLGTYYGVSLADLAAEPASKVAWPRSSAAKPINYERWKFNGSTNQLVQVYLMKEKSGSAEYDVALIFDFPDGQAPTATTDPVDLTLGTMAIGSAAARRFRGDTDDSDAIDVDGTGGAAVAF